MNNPKKIALLLLLTQLIVAINGYAVIPVCDAAPHIRPCPDVNDPPTCSDCSCTPDSNGPEEPQSFIGPQGNLSSCSNCRLQAGMPVWWVSEPYINLRMEDEPLGYTPSHGPKVTFHLSYRQRGSINYDPTIFSLGTNWSCSFREYLASVSDGSMRLHTGSAGWTYYTNGVTQYRDGSILSTPDGGVTYVIEYANGAKDVFAKQFTGTGGFAYYFITQKMDPAGNQLIYNYTNNSSIVQLMSITDSDSNNTVLYYDNASFPLQITRVVDPFARTNVLQYDPAGNLTNITDTAGLATSFIYDPANVGWITNMTTPYGITGFQIGGVDAQSSSFYTGGGIINRFIQVTLPTGGKHLYLYRQDCTAFMSGTYASVPDSSPLASTFDNVDQNYRNSFHWGPLQYNNLSSAYLTSGDVNDLTSSDYLLARQNHWLLDSATGFTSDTLSLSCDPSPDGVANGEITWYDYYNKLSGNNTIGTSAKPSFTAAILPDGTTRFKDYIYNGYSAVTEEISTYSLSYGATVTLRTNYYLYAANAVDVVSNIGPDGVTVATYGYDNNHQVIFMTNALLEVTKYTYDTNEQLSSITAPNGLLTTNIYGVDGHLIEKRIISYSTNRYTYSNDLVYSQTDERGLTVTNSWDALQRLTNVLYPDGSSLSYYYSNLDLTKIIDRMGFIKSYGYNALRQKIYDVDALGRTNIYTYCDCGALYSISNALGQATLFSYDNQGNRTQVQYPDGYTVNNSYNLIRQLATSTDSGGSSLTNYYNNQGLLVASTNNAGRVRCLTYDVNDLATNTIDANGVSVSITYDALHRALERSYPDGGNEFYGYTLNIKGPTSYTNQIANVTLYAYDTLNRKTNEIDGGISTNSYLYNGAGDLLMLTDGNGDHTRWGYDVYGRVTNKMDNLSNYLFTYQYDPDNRLTNRWSAAKNNTYYHYDAVGSLTNVVYPVSSNIALHYDVLNRLTNMVDGIGSTVYGYDAAGQLLSEDGPWASDTVNYTTPTVCGLL